MLVFLQLRQNLDKKEKKKKRKKDKKEKKSDRVKRKEKKHKRSSSSSSDEDEKKHRYIGMQFKKKNYYYLFWQIKNIKPVNLTILDLFSGHIHEMNPQLTPNLIRVTSQATAFRSVRC